MGLARVTRLRSLFRRSLITRIPASPRMSTEGLVFGAAESMSRIWLALLTTGLLASLVILGVKGGLVQADTSGQLTRGAQMFQRRCEPCHGDVGQGLAKWRLTWAPEDQNCAQTKCHGLSHPPDGFYMPVDAPAIIGANTLTRFQKARDLYAYIRHAMPFDKPGELTADEYWAVTAFLLQQHQVLPKGVEVSAANAASLSLAAAPAEPPIVDPLWLVTGLLALIGLGLVLGRLHLQRQ